MSITESLGTDAFLERKHFSRYRDLNDRRVMQLHKQIQELQGQLKSATAYINKVKDRQIVQQTRATLLNRTEKEPEEKAIDRTGVAPKEVQLDKIFYCGR